jgi:hypothetical protein
MSRAISKEHQNMLAFYKAKNPEARYETFLETLDMSSLSETEKGEFVRRSDYRALRMAIHYSHKTKGAAMLPFVLDKDLKAITKYIERYSK